MKKIKKAIFRPVVISAAVFAAYLVISITMALIHLPGIDDLARRNPENTALMEQRAREARLKKRPYRIKRAFIPYSSISPYLKKAVLVAEDAAFFSHQGIDYAELKETLKTN